MKKFLSLLLALTLVLALGACASKTAEPAETAPAAEAAPSTTETPAAAPAAEPTAEAPAAQTPAAEPAAEPAASDETYLVGICQLLPHPALDQATQGFKDALTSALGDAVVFDDQNAGGEATNCATIVDGFVAENADLILANATPPLQAAASATNTIPVLGTSVTDYATALDIGDWTGTVGGNVSGTSDLAPLDEQAKLLVEMFPEAKNVGLLYCSAEPNSVYQVLNVQAYLEELGCTATLYAFTDVNDLPAVTQTACDGSDVIYIPTDNTAAANTETIANVVIPAGTPVVAGEEGICGGCGVATLSISYYDIGYITGEMAAQILTGASDVSTMPVQYAPNVTKKYNPVICEALGIAAPEGYEAIG